MKQEKWGEKLSALGSYIPQPTINTLTLKRVNIYEGYLQRLTKLLKKALGAIKHSTVRSLTGQQNEDEDILMIVKAKVEIKG